MPSRVLCIKVLNYILYLVFSSGKFTIITFEEYISIALDATRVVGIYPEIKNPVFINQHVSISPSKSASRKWLCGTKLVAFELIEIGVLPPPQPHQKSK